MATKRRLIFLKIEYLDLKGKKVKKEEEERLRLELCQNSLKEFNKEMREFLLDKTVKIIKDYAPEPQVLIEFDEKKLDLVIDKLRSVDIVDIIDSII